MIRRLLPLALAAAGLIASVGVQASPVLLISLDGLRPGDVTEAKARGIAIPVLSGLAAEGAYAEGVIGVLPTLTYPSHTTLVTGVAPAQHGIGNNLTFDPLGINQTGWFWYASDVKVPTLWQAAHAAGLRTANVHWPVTVGAKGIDQNLPQYWRTGSEDDRKLFAELATPGLLAPLEAKLGAYPQGIAEDVEADAGRVRFAQAILERDHPGFMTVYLAGIDHQEHHSGPGSSDAIATIQRTDALIGELVASARKAMPDVTIVVVSDHGFLPVANDVNLYKPFIDAGLITLGPDGKVQGWEAEPWNAGGTAAVVLARPDDAVLRRKVRGVLATLAADRANGIGRVLERDDIAKLGGPAQATFMVAMREGYQAGRDPRAPLITLSTYKGMHGYLPDVPAMRSTLIVAGPGLSRRGSLGLVDMRTIAPSIARILGVDLPTAERPASF